MRPPKIVVIYLIIVAAVNVAFLLYKRNLNSGTSDYYHVSRMHTLLNIELVMALGSIFLWNRLNDAFAAVYFPNSVTENGAILLLPIGNRWRQICMADVIRSASSLFLLLAHLSFLFYYAWLSTEPNLLALFSLSAVGLYLHLIFFVGLGEIGYRLGKAVKKNSYLDRTCGCRDVLSLFVRKRDKLTLLAFALSVFLVLCGLHTTSNDPVVRRVHIPVTHLPYEMEEPVRIALLTDIHIGPSVGKSRIEKIVRHTNALNPDVIAISGDLADGFLVYLKEAAEPLCNLKSKHGVYFATGNHEYMHGNIDEWFQFLRGCNITVLHNENRHIKLSANQSLCMAGMDDIYAARAKFPGHGMDPNKTLEGCGKDELTVLLAHQPNAAKYVLKHGFGDKVDVILSGHTHAGQMYMFYPIVWLANSYTRGLYHDRHTDTHVLVSAGVNFFGPPIKMFGACEILDVFITPPHRFPPPPAPEVPSQFKATKSLI